VSAIATALLVFACISAGAVFGVLVRLKENYLHSDTKDVVRLGTGLIGTIAALVLGLLVSSASNTYDTESTEIRQMTANTILLDSVLAKYGPETEAARKLLRRGVANLADRIWQENGSKVANSTPFEESAESDVFYAKLDELSPTNDNQRSLKGRAIQIFNDIAQTRLLLFSQRDNSIPAPFLIVMVFWLTIIFTSFGLFAPPNAIVIGSLFVFALSAAGAIYLILELGQPFGGLMQISDVPLRSALAPLGS
jgi:hypothetical protein